MKRTEGTITYEATLFLRQEAAALKLAARMQFRLASHGWFTGYVLREHLPGELTVTPREGRELPIETLQPFLLFRNA